MKDLRRNEFIDMLNMAELLYTGNDKCIVCDIPTLGAVTYYPKADKLNVHKANKWEDNGYEFVKNVLANTTKEQIDTESITEKDVKKCEEIFSLILLAKMTLTEINTLSDKERFLLSKWFIEKTDRENKLVAGYKL